jgi:hypothetical protein
MITKRKREKGADRKEEKKKKGKSNDFFFSLNKTKNVCNSDKTLL